MRRVVITGLGMVSPLACGVEETWSRLIAGRSGARRISRFDPSHLACHVACELPHGDGSEGTFNPDDDWDTARADLLAFDAEHRLLSRVTELAYSPFHRVLATPQGVFTLANNQGDLEIAKYDLP